MNYKNIPQKELDTLFNSIQFKTKLYRHQLVSLAFTLGERLSRVMFLHDIGVGKSCAALALLRCYNPIGKTLIICPNSVIGTWKTEIQKHSNFTYTILKGSKQDRLEKFKNNDTDIYIINYSGLKTIGAKKVGNKTIPDINSIKSFGFEAIIADECFPYNQKVTTNIGEIEIGYIVENKLDVKILSYNHKKNILEWKTIKRFISNTSKNKKFAKILHENGNFTCTLNHKLYIKNKGYLQTKNLLNKNGEFYGKETYLLSLQKEIFRDVPSSGGIEEKPRKKGILFQNLFKPISRFRQRITKKNTFRKLENSSNESCKKTRSKKKIFRNPKRKTRNNNKKLQIVWKRNQINSIKKSRSFLKKNKNKILFCKVRNKLEISTVGIQRKNKNFKKECWQKNFRGSEEKPFRKSRKIQINRCGIFQKDERKQSYVQSRNLEKNENVNEGQNIFKSWRQSKKNARTNYGSRSIGLDNGITYKNKTCLGNFTQFTHLLQSRHSKRRIEDSNRNRWKDSQFEETKIYRQKKRNCIESSRLEDITIYKRRGAKESSKCSFRNKKVYNLEIEDNHNYFVNGILVSNCHHLKNSQAQQTRIAQVFTKYSRYVILMTGTPIAQSAINFFGQCLVLDNGNTFGTSYYSFLNFYYYKPFSGAFTWQPKRVCNICNELYSYKKAHLKTHDITPIQYRAKYPKKEITAEELILAKVAEKAISYSREECFDLPERVYEVREVNLTKEQQEMTAKVIEGLNIEELKGQTIPYHTQKLLQISSGFLIKENETYIFEKNPKLVELKNVLEQITEKFIIYIQYHQEIKIVSALLSKMKIKYVELYGKTKDKTEAIDKFINDKTYRCLLGHPKSAGEGLNLQCANIVIFFSNGYIGTTLRSQAEGRTYRSGQKKHCLYIDIIALNSIDSVLYNSLKNKTDYVQNVLKYLQKKKENNNA